MTVVAQATNTSSSYTNTGNNQVNDELNEVSNSSQTGARPCITIAIYIAGMAPTSNIATDILLRLLVLQPISLLLPLTTSSITIMASVQFCQHYHHYYCY